jgi:flagellar biosynthesis/type III secretory pathway protein FliH
VGQVARYTSTAAYSVDVREKSGRSAKPSTAEVLECVESYLHDSYAKESQPQACYCTTCNVEQFRHMRLWSIVHESDRLYFTGRQAGRQAGRQTGGQAGRQAGRQAGGQAGRQAGGRAGGLCSEEANSMINA